MHEVSQEGTQVVRPLLRLSDGLIDVWLVDQDLVQDSRLDGVTFP
jgi:hypothetical protein